MGRPTATAIHPVLLRQRVAAMRMEDRPYLDEVELHRWAHALTRADVWVLYDSDTASIRFGFLRNQRGLPDTIGSLLADIGFGPAVPLRGNDLAALAPTVKVGLWTTKRFEAEIEPAVG